MEVPQPDPSTLVQNAKTAAQIMEERVAAGEQIAPLAPVEITPAPAPNPNFSQPVAPDHQLPQPPSAA